MQQLEAALQEASAMVGELLRQGGTEQVVAGLQGALMLACLHASLDESSAGR